MDTVEHENTGCKVLIGDITDVSDTHTNNRDQNAMWQNIKLSAIVGYIARTIGDSSLYKGS